MATSIKKLQHEVALLRQRVQELEESKRVFQAILDNAPALISSKDLQGNILLANQQFNLLEGPSAEEFIGKNVFELFSEEIAQELWDNDCSAREKDGPIETEESVYHKDGSLHTYFTVKFPLKREDTTFATCAFSVDITNLKEAEREKNTDQLTGLFNRGLFDSKLTEEFRRAQRSGAYLAFIIIDIDHFKLLNDALGHLAGDRALIKVAATLKEIFKREYDFIFRFGGEEFAGIFSVKSKEEAESIARDVIGSIPSLEIPNPQSPVHQFVTVSAGLKVVAPREKITEVEIIEAADSALYRAKREGRNRLITVETELA